MRVTYEDVVAAAERIAGGVIETPCMPYEALAERLGGPVYVKMDNLQRTGSFKERGARNALLQLDESQRKIGVVAASAGNHALGLALHGRELGIPVTVVMPASAPLVKRMTCVKYGANVVSCGQTFFEAYEKAQALSSEHGYAYIHGYDAPAIIAGQGTMGLEILAQVKAAEGRYPDAMVVPIGGGGLIAGIAAAVKHLSPETKIYGIEPKRAATYAAAVEAGAPVHVDVKKTIADGLATPDVGGNAFDTAHGQIDGAYQVTEEALSLAVLRLMEREKTVVEGAGVAGVAAVLSELEPTLEPCGLPDMTDQLIAIPLCGGNIDPAMIGRVIERGLAADGRLVRFETTISDRPGGLAALAEAISAAGGSVKDILHDRAFATSDLASVDVRCVIETTGPEGAEALYAQLADAGFEVRLMHGRPDFEAPGG